MIEHKEGGDGVEELHGKIFAWQRWLTFFAAALIISYVAYFGLFLGQPRAVDSDKWGAFGDFFGGVLNPIVAFAAFYWLTQSVKLQKQELAETRAELAKSADAQRQLVENANLSLQVSATAALVNSVEGQLKVYENHLFELNGRKIPAMAKDYVLQVHALEEEINAVADRINSLNSDRTAYYMSLKRIVDAYGQAILAAQESSPQ